MDDGVVDLCMFIQRFASYQWRWARAKGGTINPDGTLTMNVAVVYRLSTAVAAETRITLKLIRVVLIIVIGTHVSATPSTHTQTHLHYAIDVQHCCHCLFIVVYI